MTRPTFSLCPKMPSAQPAVHSSCGRSSRSTQRTQSTFGGKSVSSRPSSWPVPAIRNSNSGTSRAAARIVSSPWFGMSLPWKKHRNGSVLLHPGRKTLSSVPRKHTATRSRSNPACATRKSALPSVSATTRSARRKAVRSTAFSNRARSDVAFQRRRSSTSASYSDTAGLKTSGRLPAARRASGMSKCPGYPTIITSNSSFGRRTSLSSARARRSAAPTPAAYLCRCVSHTGERHSTTSTPAFLRHAMTSALRG